MMQGPRDQADALGELLVSDPLKLCAIQGLEGMRHDQQRQVWHAIGLCRCLRQTDKLLGDDGDGRDATLLQFHCVMDTPRRTGASGG